MKIKSIYWNKNEYIELHGSFNGFTIVINGKIIEQNLPGPVALVTYEEIVKQNERFEK